MNSTNGTEQRPLSTATTAQLVNGVSKAPQQEQDSAISLDAIAQTTQNRLAIDRAPQLILEEAQKAACALQNVIASKPRKVMFNGEQYLEFEDWQTLGNFYGLTARVRHSAYVEFGEARGFEAVADVLVSGEVISTAESMCLNDEERWNQRPKYEGYGRNRKLVGYEPVPLFQLRSMSQTRACAKALRNVLSWVVVLAGYRATPAEEMDGVPGFDAELPRPIDTGGYAYGTREASEYVRDRKLAEIAERKPAAKAEKPWRSFGGMRESFRVARERVGEVIWLQLLQEYGVENPAQFKTTETALECYNRMLELANSSEVS